MLQIESLQLVHFPRPHVACPDPSTSQDENANSSLKLHSKHAGVQSPEYFRNGACTWSMSESFEGTMVPEAHI